MFGIGIGEMVVIGVLLLIAVGPDKLPTMVKTVAKTYRQFRRAATDIRASTGLDDFLRDEELKELADLRKQKLMMLSESKPGAVKPVAGKAIADKAGADKTGADKTVAGKPVINKPTVLADEGAPIPAAKIAPAPALTLKQRIAEVPPQGVDVAEAQVASIPATRTDAASHGTAPTEKA